MAKIIPLSGFVGFDITATDLRAELASAKGGDVELHVNSPGGFVFEGVELFNLIREHTGHVEARIVGLAASAASYFILAADKITAFDNATFMIHNAWNFVAGDHNDLRKAANTLESLSDIFAREYARATGKELADMKSLMDVDTFLFGDEILKAGFVDEILDAPDDSDNDKASVVLAARASVEICLDKMRNSEAANEDFNRAVAHIEKIAPLLPTPSEPAPKAQGVPPNTTIDPAVAGKVNNKEEAKMTFKEFLDANPSARAEYDAAIATARADGEKGARDELAAIVAKVEPYLKSKDYSATVKEHAVKAITGEGHIATVETLVAVEDQAAEVAKEAAALLEQQNEETGATGADGVDAKAQAEYDDRKKRLGGK